MNDALKWALHSFKTRAMSITHDQLHDEVQAILCGQARITKHGAILMLIYAENDSDWGRKNHFGTDLKTKDC